MRLIGVHGRLTSGKDTLFATIEQAAIDSGYLALRRAFADPLKVSGMRALGCNDEYATFADETQDQVELANKIKETGRILVTYDDVNPFTGNLVPKALIISGREFWQRYGTEAHRAADLGASFGEDFWVDNLLPLGETQPELSKFVLSDSSFTSARPKFWENFKESWAGYADIAVVTDVRFPNEAQRILDLDGEIWWIDAEERLGPNTDTHASEKKLDDRLITHTVDNNGTLAQFQQNILEIL